MCVCDIISTTERQMEENPFGILLFLFIWKEKNMSCIVLKSSE